MFIRKKWQQRLQFFVVFIFLTVILTIGLFYIIFQQSKQTNIEYFKICVMVDNKPQVIYFKNYNKSIQPICDKKLDYFDNSDGNFYSLRLTLIQETKLFKEWQLVENTGGPGDPNIYRYRITKNTLSAEPLWHQHADNFSWFLSGWFAFFIAFVITKVLWRILPRLKLLS